jgi:hypothetical protein
MDIWRDASPYGNHGIPPKWDRWTTASAYAGVTIDALRPTLVINDNGVIGATGIAFNVGTLFSPWTYWYNAGTYGYAAGITLGGLGITFGPGTTGGKMLTAQHFYLKNGLSLSTDMDLFIVFRPYLDSATVNYGFVGSNLNATNSFFNQYEDHVLHCRNWSYVDRIPAAQTTSNYIIDENGKRYYSSTSSFMFRPYGRYADTTPVDQKQILGYDPHVSGACMGMVIGEAARDTQNNLYGWYNGDRARNYSPSTGLRIGHEITQQTLSETPVCGVTVDIGRFGGYIKHLVVVNNGIAGSSAWVGGATSDDSFGFYGVVNEVIVFSRKLQETERQEVYGYLARKYKLDTKLPDSYSRSHPSAYLLGLNYWTIEHHPNTKGITGLPSGVSFGAIALQDFFNMPDTIYKSEGTVVGDGTVLTSDTYTKIGP